MFAKTPKKGKVKTRLARDTTDDFAVAFYQACLQYLFTVLQQSNSDILLYLTPDSQPDYFFPFNPDQIFFQQGDDLGMRMKTAIETQLAHYGRLILIGSDIPGLNQDIITQAQNTLTNNEAVIGPAADGGYYLIGFKQNHFTDCFHHIQWSTDTVFEKTLSHLSQAKVKLLPICSDVDTLEDLRSLYHAQLLPPSIQELLAEYPEWFNVADSSI